MKKIIIITAVLFTILIPTFLSAQNNSHIDTLKEDIQFYRDLQKKLEAGGTMTKVGQIAIAKLLVDALDHIIYLREYNAKLENEAIENEQNIENLIKMSEKRQRYYEDLTKTLTKLPKKWQKKIFLGLPKEYTDTIK